MADLLKGYDTTATIYEVYAALFHKGTKGLNDLAGVGDATKGIESVEKKLDADLKKRCAKIARSSTGDFDAGLATGTSSLSPSPPKPPKVAGPRTQTTYCPNGLTAINQRMGCVCGDYTSDIQAPAPGPNCTMHDPQAQGSACIWQCR